jgi:hypothetical protein
VAIRATVQNWCCSGGFCERGDMAAVVEIIMVQMHFDAIYFCLLFVFASHQNYDHHYM